MAPQLLLDPASIASELHHWSLYAFQCHTMRIANVTDGAMRRLLDMRSPLIGSSVAAAPALQLSILSTVSSVPAPC